LKDFRTFAGLCYNDADRIEQHTAQSVEEMSEEDLKAAMKELGIQSIELTDEEFAAKKKEILGL
jgi:hypothetical protein